MSGLNTSSADGIARVVFDRASVLNALSPAVLDALVAACGDIARDESIKVVRFEGAGSSFSAGADLPAFLSALGSDDPQRIADLGRIATNAIAELPQITIAGIHGNCVGGGLVLAAACDIRIASDDARFLIPELEAGIPLAWGGMSWLVRLVGETLAADLVLSCRAFGAEEALQGGFVSRVVDAERLQEEVAELAASVAAKSSYVLRVTKRQLLELRSGTFDAREDARAMLGAQNDPESLRQGMAYVRSRIRHE